MLKEIKERFRELFQSKKVHYTKYGTEGAVYSLCGEMIPAIHTDCYTRDPEKTNCSACKKKIESS